MKLIIAGGRDFSNYDLLENEVKEISDNYREKEKVLNNEINKLREKYRIFKQRWKVYCSITRI